MQFSSPAAEVLNPCPSQGISRALYVCVRLSQPSSHPALNPCLLFVCHQISSLKNRLKKVSTTTGDGVARAFLKAQAAFFGSYRNALKIEPVSSFLAFTNLCLVRAEKCISVVTGNQLFIWLLNSPRRGCASVLWGARGVPSPWPSS